MFLNLGFGLLVKVLESNKITKFKHHKKIFKLAEYSKRRTSPVGGASVYTVAATLKFSELYSIFTNFVPKFPAIVSHE